MFTVDVILPLYKPHQGWEGHILAALPPLREYFEQRNWHLHLYLVNDGSPMSYYPPETVAAIRRAAGDMDFLSYDVNRGKGYSLRFGVRAAAGDVTVYTDGDFPFGWESVAAAAQKLADGADIVMGVRGSEYGEALCSSRKFISGCARRMNRLLLGLPDGMLDTQAGMKGFSLRGRKAFLAAKTETFLFDTEFILLGYNAGMKIETVNMRLREGLHFSRMGLRVILRELRHFIRILWEIRLCGRFRNLKEAKG